MTVMLDFKLIVLIMLVMSCMYIAVLDSGCSCMVSDDPLVSSILPVRKGKNINWTRVSELSWHLFGMPICRSICQHANHVTVVRFKKLNSNMCNGLEGTD